MYYTFAKLAIILNIYIKAAFYQVNFANPALINGKANGYLKASYWQKLFHKETQWRTGLVGLG